MDVNYLLTQVINLTWQLGILLGFLIGFLVLWRSGYLVKRPYRLVIKVPRANGTFKTLLAKGRYLKNGKFEIQYAWNNSIQVNPPDEGVVKEGNVIEGLSKTRSEIVWLEDETIDEKNIGRTAVIPEAAQLAYASAFETDWERTHRANKWEKFAVPLSFLFGALLILAGIYMYGQMMSESNMAIAASNREVADSIHRLVNPEDFKQTETTTTTGPPPG